MPARDVLRYNKSIGWSHQEFVESWGLWRYVIGSPAPLYEDFSEWLNADDEESDLEAAAAASAVEAQPSNPAARARM